MSGGWRRGFSWADVSIDTNSGEGVALGDVDGDGNLDAVFANQNEINRVCEGDGAGGFTCADVSADTNRSAGVALGDVDGDGNLDAVFANTASQRNRVCFGDGVGGFSCADVSTDTISSLGMALAPGAPPFSKDAASCQKTIGKELAKAVSKVMQAHSKCLDNEAKGKACDTAKRDEAIAKALGQAEKKLDKKCTTGEYAQLGFPINETAPAIRDSMLQAAQDAGESLINKGYVAGYVNKP